MKTMSRKSEAGLAAIFIIVLLVLGFGYLINLGQRECKSNKDCGSEEYCGSDFSCHAYPTIQKTVVQNNFVWPSIIIAIAIIIAAVIFNWDRILAKKSHEEHSHEPNSNDNHGVHDSDERAGKNHEEEYYKSNMKTP